LSPGLLAEGRKEMAFIRIIHPTASPTSWSSDADLQVRDGAPFCTTTHRILPPWICSLFQLLASIIVRLDRRNLVWINVTANPTAEWISRQLTEAFPWDNAPRVT